MVLESALIPIPSEIIMPFSGFLVTTGSLGSIDVILTGSLGNLVGSIATYFLGIKLGRAFLIKYGRYIFFIPKHLAFTEEMFRKYGEKIVFVGRLLPGLRNLCLTTCWDRKDKFQVHSLHLSRIFNLEYNTYLCRISA